MPELISSTASTGNSAAVHLPREHLDPATEAQIARMVDHPAVAHACVMPDCHKGTGCCVGFTSVLQHACVSPAIIGGDIGCGISAIPVSGRPLTNPKATERVLRAIHAAVPMGNGAKGDHAEAPPPAGVGFMDQVLQHADRALDAFVAAYDARHAGGGNDDAKWSDSRPSLTAAWLEQRLSAWGLSMTQLLRQAGTLGGGNHFVELGARDDASKDVEEPDEETPAAGGTGACLPEGLLIVHSGSRCVGQAVYRYWMKQALASSTTAAAPDTTNDDDEDAAATGGDITSRLAAAPRNDDDEVDVSAYGTGVVLRDAAARGYLVDMVFAQSFAVHNRTLMLRRIAESANLALPTTPSGSRADEEADVAGGDDGLSSTERLMRQLEAADDAFFEMAEDDHVGFDECDEQEAELLTTPTAVGELALDPALVVDSTHNYIDFADWVVRKGAIAAHAGQRCLIAQNMRDGVWLCSGRGAADWNYSAPHGTGRVKGRSAAAARDRRQAEVLLRQFRSEMSGILSYSVSAETLDERPSVYRDSGVVRSAMRGAVAILAHYRPLASAK